MADSNINALARSFHDRYATQPDLKQCMAVHQEVTGLLTAPLRQLGQEVCINIEYMGSSYEGTKVKSLKPGESDYEFDLMVVRRNPNLQVQKTNIPGFYWLQVGGERLSRQKTYDKFKGTLQNAIDTSGLSAGVKMRTHGAAADLDVNYRGQSYSVDMTPTYEQNGKYYVPRAPKPALGNVSMMKGVSSTDQEFLWFQSFALEEKKKLVDGDTGDGCRREVYRMCKVISQLRQVESISSYMWKNALLNEMQANQGRNWNRYTELGNCAIAVIQGMAKALEKGNLPMRFNPYINLLLRMSDDTRQNLEARLKGLIKKPDMLFKVSSIHGLETGARPYTSSRSDLGADEMKKHTLHAIGDADAQWMGCGVCNVPVLLCMTNHIPGRKHQMNLKVGSCPDIPHTSGTWIRCDLCGSVQPNMEAAKNHTKQMNHRARMRGDPLPPKSSRRKICKD